MTSGLQERSSPVQAGVRTLGGIRPVTRTGSMWGEIVLRAHMRWAAVSVLALLAGGVSAPVAAAAVGLPTITGVVKVEAPSLNNSAMAKSVTVTCPTGKRLIDAGGNVVGGGGKVSMDDIYPDLTANSVTVSGKEIDPLDTNWWVSAVATCADEPSGLELVTTASSPGSLYIRAVTATCPTGKTLLGDGATITGGKGEVILDTVAPNGGSGTAATDVTVEAFESSPFADDWLINAFAICADPLSGQQRVSDSTGLGSANNGARATCTGQVETGSGTEIAGVYGVVAIAGEYPVDGSAVSAPTATTVYGEEVNGTTGDWYITAFALCADG